MRKLSDASPPPPYGAPVAVNGDDITNNRKACIPVDGVVGDRHWPRAACRQHDGIGAAALYAVTSRCRVTISSNNSPDQCAGFADVDGGSDRRRLTSRHQQRNAGERPFPLPLPASPQAMGQGFELLRISAKPGRRSGFHCKQCCLIWLPNRLVTDCLTLSLPGRQRGWSKRAGGHWAPGAAPRIVIALS